MLKAFLVIRVERFCVEVREFEDDGEARKAADEIFADFSAGRGGRSAQLYFCDSRETLEDDSSCRVGGSLDDKYRDSMDYCSDLADGDVDGE